MNMFDDGFVNTGIDECEECIKNGAECEECIEAGYYSHDDMYDDSYMHAEYGENDKTNNSTIHPPSAEQQLIIAAIGAATQPNIIVDSVAGSGKTTTVLHIARQYPGRRILLLTYNNRLSRESRERAMSLGCKNLTISTFHAYVHKHHGPCINDDQLATFIKTTKQFKPAGFDLIIIDEAQDITPLLWLTIRRILAADGWPQTMVIGDTNQAIYQYAGADSRFISKADILFAAPAANGRTWLRLKLATSYRVTRRMAALVNHLAGEERMTAVKGEAVCGISNDNSDADIDDNNAATAVNPDLYYCVAGIDSKFVGEKIIELIRSGTAYDDIFILAPSVKQNNNQIARLIDILTDAKIPIFKPTSDNMAGNYKALIGKVVFSSFHQAKGLERPIVFAFDVDTKYYDWFGQDYERGVLPNPIYVAITRATQQLFVIHRSKHGPIGRGDIPTIRQIAAATHDIHAAAHTGRPSTAGPQKPTGVTSIIERLPAEDIRHLMATYIDVQQLIPPSSNLGIPTISTQPPTDNWGILHEEVSNITGVVIPAVFEYECSGRMAIFDELPAAQQPADISSPANHISNPESLLRIGNHYLSHRDDTKYRLRQIRQYNWMSKWQLGASLARMRAMVRPDNTVINEIYVSATMTDDDNGTSTYNAYIDMIAVPAHPALLAGPASAAQPEVWEIKCVGQLTSVHILQAAINAQLYYMADNKSATALLFNVLTGEVLRINVLEPGVAAQQHEAGALMREVTCLRLHNHRGRLSDDDFMALLEAYAAGRPPIHVACGECKSADIVCEINRLPRYRVQCDNIIREVVCQLCDARYGPEDVSPWNSSHHDAYQLAKSRVIIAIDYDAAGNDCEGGEPVWQLRLRQYIEADTENPRRLLVIHYRDVLAGGAAGVVTAVTAQANLGFASLA